MDHKCEYCGYDGPRAWHVEMEYTALSMTESDCNDLLDALPVELRPLAALDYMLRYGANSHYQIRYAGSVWCRVNNWQRLRRPTATQAAKRPNVSGSSGRRAWQYRDLWEQKWKETSECYLKALLQPSC